MRSAEAMRNALHSSHFISILHFRGIFYLHLLINSNCIPLRSWLSLYLSRVNSTSRSESRWQKPDDCCLVCVAKHFSIVDVSCIRWESVEQIECHLVLSLCLHVSTYPSRAVSTAAHRTQRLFQIWLGIVLLCRTHAYIIIVVIVVWLIRFHLLRLYSTGSSFASASCTIAIHLGDGRLRGKKERKYCWWLNESRALESFRLAFLFSLFFSLPSAVLFSVAVRSAIHESRFRSSCAHERNGWKLNN